MEVSAPFSYGTENIYNSLFVPSEVHYLDNRLAQFFRKYLLQKAMSVFKWDLPEGWNKDYFLYTLFCYGYLAVVETNKFGVIPQKCGFTGFNVYYAPLKVRVSNPLLDKVITATIDKDCVVFKLQPDYASCLDLIDYYAAKLATASAALDANLLNSKLAYVLCAGNKASAESLKKLFDKVMSGEPAVVYDKNLNRPDGEKAWDYFSNNLKQNYIASDILSDMRKIEAMFDTEVGIPNANTDKKERLVTDEVNANNVETSTRAELWLEQLKESCDKANKMFNINISVDWRVNPYESNNVSDGSVQLRQYDI